MSTKFPLQINNLRFFVNPTALSISKSVNYAPLPTQGGVKYQVWYDNPEVLTITGASAGKTAYQELVFLKKNFERTDKVSELFYKTRVYKGIITNMTLEHSTTHINQFTYSITFQLLQGEKFAIEDFSITGKETGKVASILNQFEKLINEPISRLSSSIDKFLGNI